MKNKGFTLVELLAVIAILAILVIIALPNVLKMFNDSKKNSFLTEAKTLYSEASKKYISETMKGNKLTYVSSEDDTKLEMTGRDLQYCVLLNDDGSVKSMKVSNGEWIAELPDNKKITDLKSSDLKDVPSGYKFECNGSTSQTPLPSKSFTEDSWDTIASNVKAGNTDKYKVGDTKEVDLGTYGKHKVRIANKSTPDECKQEGFSQSACGFVVEFTDIITTHNINPTVTNKGGWPKSQMKTFINNDIYNSLPNELKSIIITTKTISGHGELDSENHISIDKLYLLATAEVWKDGDHADAARDKTRQLDYYNSKGVTTSSYAAAIKKDSTGTAAEWWLRSASSDFDFVFYYSWDNGAMSDTNADYSSGVSPAFRIG
jgi:prepilin-type N-terminal cleavage/methylation domain-containing protein